MAFDVNGVFQRLFNWGNDRDADINIRADRMDGEMDNLADGLTRIVAGDENFRGGIKAPNGLVGAPAFSFSGADTTGFYRKLNDSIGVGVLGVEKLEISGAGVSATGSISATGDVSATGNISATGDVSATGNISATGSLLGALRSVAVTGALDWNDETNARVGVGHSLLRGDTAANAPTDTDEFYTPFTFGHMATPNTRTQFAIPYSSGGVHHRHRATDGTWTDWKTFADKAALDAHTARTDNPHNVTKVQVELGNVDNTADADKPVSSAQSSALDLKLNKNGGEVSGDIDMGGNAILNAVMKVNGVTLKKIHSIRHVTDDTIYSRESTEFGSASFPSIEDFSFVNSNSKMLIVAHGTCSIEEAGTNGLDVGGTLQLAYFDGTQYVLVGQNSQVLLSNYNASSTSNLRGRFLCSFIFDSTHLRSDTGAFLPRIRHRAAYANNVVTTYAASFIIVEFE